ncbi:MAG: glycosyltransferase family 2 protein [Thermotogae bacterium]|nr:glycosyltransferase family 2 protein [Thermotogota bacterium]
MKVSVVIPTLNAGERLERLLKSLRSQTVDTEIIVIDSSSDDGTPALASRMADVLLVVAREEFNHGLTRNLGLRAASSDVVVFMSQDALPENSRTLEVLTEPIFAGDVVMAYARHIPPPGTKPPEVFFRHFSYPPESEVRDASMLPKYGLRVFANSNVCAAYLREKLLEVGGFPRVILSEDLYVAAKLILAGYRTMYNAEARVIHAHDFNPLQIFRRYFSVGVFYAENRWLRRYGGRGDTLRFVLRELEFLAENHPLWIPYALAENAMRILGLILGYNHRLLPKFLLPLLSGYRYYWVRG